MECGGRVKHIGKRRCRFALPAHSKMPATLRGFPRKIVAATSAAEDRKTSARLKIPAFPNEYANLIHPGVRGIAVAKGVITMNPMTTVDVNASEEPSTASDWLTHYGDYLFNFA